MDEIEARLLGTNPVPLWLVSLPAGQHFRPPFNEFELLLKLDEDLIGCDFRAVSIDRLSYVLEAGVDVDPPDSPLWVDCFDKAWEYGGWPKVMLALDPDSLEPTFREVLATLEPPQLEELRRLYPTVLESRDGTKIWLSRLSEKDSRLASPYERSYARWLPRGNDSPLRAVMLFARPEDGLNLPAEAS